jgi:hypothetical protein
VRNLTRIFGLAAIAVVLGPSPSFGWGNEGHEIIATVAASYLQKTNPETLSKINSLLKRDRDNELTDTDIASEATWADAYRESGPAARNATRQWHFVDIDYANEDIDKALDSACFGHPKPNTEASEGPAAACVIDRINAFKFELADLNTSPQERLLALKYLLHFVGDVQPLHTATHFSGSREDFGGNCVGILRGRATVPVRLHAYWDTTLVQRAVGKDVETGADSVFVLLTPPNVQKWSGGTAADWAKESFGIARDKVYAGVIDHEPEKTKTNYMFKGRDGKPDARCGKSNVYRIGLQYELKAAKTVTEQLAKAGLRLAELLQQTIQ